ncbi:MAG: hypothetical protein N3D75_03495 [Candidatus Aenigmarchaeota archaeon]|nr:hypothetical protein [Candidatus Aenigmarchaeota archaeon]
MYDYFCENDGVYNHRSPECINCFYRKLCQKQLYEDSGIEPPDGMHYLDSIEQIALSRRNQIPGIQDLSNHQ